MIILWSCLSLQKCRPLSLGMDIALHKLYWAITFDPMGTARYFSRLPAALVPGNVAVSRIARHGIALDIKTLSAYGPYFHLSYICSGVFSGDALWGGFRRQVDRNVSIWAVLPEGLA